MSYVTKQSFVQAIDDDFLLAAVITMVCAIPVLFLKIGKKGRGKNTENVSNPNPNAGEEQQQQSLIVTSEVRN
jgi:5,10-methenyltetrahydromethanopterin hydrogenase